MVVLNRAGNINFIKRKIVILRELRLYYLIERNKIVGKNPNQPAGGNSVPSVHQADGGNLLPLGLPKNGRFQIIKEVGEKDQVGPIFFKKRSEIILAN